MNFTSTQQIEIDHARDILKSYGFYVDNLWHIADVKNWYECADDEAYDILANAMKNEATYSQIWMSIEYAIESKKEE
jgi:hypothetical protein